MIPYLCQELAGEAKRSAEIRRESSAVLHRDRPAQLDGVPEDGHSRRVRAGHVSHQGINLEAAHRIGDYRPDIKSPDDPDARAHRPRPCKPGLSARDQQRAGHAELLTTPFSTFERNIRDQMARILGPGGFDPARDIEAITVNRWPHGYAYEYNYLWDPEWPKGHRPARSDASLSDESSSPIPTPPRPLTRTRPSIRPIARFRNNWRRGRGSVSGP